MARNLKAPRTDTTGAPADIINYDEAVREGRKILARIEDAERDQLRLGELADKLEPKYKDRTLAKFANEIGVAKCTLDRYRTVYRAWAGKLAPGPNSISYAVLRELATHPDREEIIRENPKITKRAAHDLMRKQEYAAQEKQVQEQENEWRGHSRKWYKNLVALGNEATRIAGAVDVDQFTPEQLETWRGAINPKLLLHVRQGGHSLIRIADRLAGLCGSETELDCEPTVAAPLSEAAE